MNHLPQNPYIINPCIWISFFPFPIFTIGAVKVILLLIILSIFISVGIFQTFQHITGHQLMKQIA